MSSSQHSSFIVQHEVWSEGVVDRRWEDVTVTYATLPEATRALNDVAARHRDRTGVRWTGRFRLICRSVTEHEVALIDNKAQARA